MPSVKSAAIVTHGHAEPRVAAALEHVRRIAAENGVELQVDDERDGRPDIAIVLGGDGTMLRALTRFLGTGVPVIGVNYGRVGFLTAMPAQDLDDGIRRVFAGEYRAWELSTLEVSLDDTNRVAVNDIVVAGGILGRMVELGYSIGGEDLGAQPCDGLICASPAGSTAYNLSNGGPVLVWGIDAMVLTFVAPHTLHIRPLVVPRGPEVVVTNRTEGVVATVLADGHEVGPLPYGESVTVRLASERSLLATLPEVTFFTRYAATFGR